MRTATINETETRDFRKPKRGTIGYEVSKLVKRYGGYGIGHYILASALIEACGMHASDLLTIGGKQIPDKK